MAFGSAQVTKIHRGLDFLRQEFSLTFIDDVFTVRSAAHFVDSVLGHEHLHVLVFVEFVCVGNYADDFKWFVNPREERASTIHVFLDPSDGIRALADVIPVVREAQRVDESGHLGFI